MQDYFPKLMAVVAANPGTSLPQLQAAIDEHPGDARPWLLVAAEHASSGRADDAEAAYIAALQRAPHFSIARFQLGLLQFGAARPAAARASWAPLQALPEHDPLRLFVKGLEYLSVDNLDAAVHWLQQGLAHNRDNAPLNHDMQMVLDRIGALQAHGEDEATGAHFLVSAYGNR